MKAVFVDSNVFLRFFTIDEAGQHDQAAALFAAASAGKVRLVTGPPVLFEMAWTLRSAHKLSKEQVLDAVEAMAAFKGLELSDRHLVEEAVRLARTSGQEYTDAYLFATANELGAEMATFNSKHFDKMGGELYRF